MTTNKLSTFQKMMIGGIGAIMPVVITLINGELNTFSVGLDPSVAIGYLIRTSIFFGLGCLWIYLNNEPHENNKWKLFQLGTVAPALITSVIATNGIQSSQNDLINPESLRNGSESSFFHFNIINETKNSEYIVRDPISIFNHITRFLLKENKNSLMLDITIEHIDKIDLKDLEKFKSKYNLKLDNNILYGTYDLSNLVNRADFINNMNSNMPLPKRSYTTTEKIQKGFMGNYSEENYLIIIAEFKNIYEAKLKALAMLLENIETRVYFDKPSQKYIVIRYNNKSESTYFKSYSEMNDEISKINKIDKNIKAIVKKVY